MKIAMRQENAERITAALKSMKGIEMSGCYGGSLEDRYFEAQLNEYLEDDDDAEYESWRESQEDAKREELDI